MTMVAVMVNKGAHKIFVASVIVVVVTVTEAVVAAIAISTVVVVRIIMTIVRGNCCQK
jgi:hypothetical protein